MGDIVLILSLFKSIKTIFMNSEKNRNKKEEREDQHKRIDLNNPKEIKDGDKTLRKHSDQNIKDLDRNLNEQFGGTDNTVAPTPNEI
jgi:hypothetical protein